MHVSECQNPARYLSLKMEAEKSVKVHHYCEVRGCLGSGKHNLLCLRRGPFSTDELRSYQQYIGNAAPIVLSTDSVQRKAAPMQKKVA